MSTGVLGPDEFRRVADGALSLQGADDVEVLLIHEWGGLTRFANSEIHQSISREDTALRVRVAKAGHIGVSASNDATPEGAAAAARSALEMADVVAADPMWPGLAPTAGVPEVDRFFEGTAAVSPEVRADAVAELIGGCAPACTAAGAYETLAVELGLANSEGQFCWAPSTQASLTTVVTGPDGGSGFAEAFAGSTDAIDAAAIGATASDKAVASVSPRPLERRHVHRRARTRRHSDARGLPRLGRLRRTRVHRGPLMLQREGRHAGRRPLDLDMGRRLGPAHTRRALRLRGHARCRRSS